MKGVWSYSLPGVYTPFLSLIRHIAGRETGLYWRVTRKGQTRRQPQGSTGSQALVFCFCHHDASHLQLSPNAVVKETQNEVGQV